jgi:hypothetical protein
MKGIVALLALSGCSFALVKAPPATPPRDRIAHCTSSALPMVVDVGLAVGAAYATAAYADEASGSMETREDKLIFWGPLAAGAALTTLAIASSVYGYKASQRCNTYQLEHAARLRGDTIVSTQGDE